MDVTECYLCTGNTQYMFLRDKYSFWTIWNTHGFKATDVQIFSIQNKILVWVFYHLSLDKRFFSAGTQQFSE
jgi:hypothetical protein